MKKIYRYSLGLLLLMFFSALLLLAAGFFAVREGWTNVSGEEDKNSAAYNSIAQQEPIVSLQVSVLPKNLSIYGEHENLNWCRLGVVAQVSPYDARGMFLAYQKTKSENLLEHMFLALELRQGTRSDLAKSLSACQNKPGSWNEKTLSQFLNKAETPSAYTWQNGEAWQIIKQSIVKDQALINATAKKVGVQPRLLVSVAIVEQLRLYYTQREIYEKFFKPLKILANANKMAWGIMSIKEKMAMQTEEHLTDKTSPFYLGESSEKLLDFPQDVDVAKERYRRLTDESNHYYSYLYGSLIIKQFQEQWSKAGINLTYRPEIIATLFNIGFDHSQPKAEPIVGGSTLIINGEKYFFGSLAYEFYYSGELALEFPFE